MSDDSSAAVAVKQATISPRARTLIQAPPKDDKSVTMERPASSEDPKQTQRKMVAEEILSTEKTYAAELGRFVEVFCPRMEACDTPAKQRFMHELAGLINNLEQFLFIARQAVQELTLSSRLRVGPSLLRLTSVLPLYTQYAKHYALASQSIRELMRDEEFQKDWRGDERDRSSIRITKSTKSIRRTASMDSPARGSAQSTGNVLKKTDEDTSTPPPVPSQRPQSLQRVTSLEGFLILPVQRVPRYVLLFQELLKRMDGEALSSEVTKERQDLEQALEAARSCASGMNDAIETVKRLEGLKDLQTRFNNDASLLAVFSHAEAKIMRANPLVKVSRNGQRKEYQYFLIAPDAILCASDDGGMLRLRRLLRLTPRACSVDVRDEDGPCGFVLETADRTQTLIAPSASVRDAWVEDLNKLMAVQNLKTPPSLPRRSFFSRRQSSAPTAISAAGKDAGSLPSLLPIKTQRSFSSGQQHSDDSPLAVACTVCGSGFSLLMRKHACGRCRRDVCASCSAQRRALLLGQGSAVRCCDICAEEMDAVSESLEGDLARLAIEISGSFRREGGNSTTEKLPREPFWGLAFDGQHRGPSSSGKFLCTLPFRADPFPKAVLLLLGKQGSTEVAQAELDIQEMVRNPRSQHGFTERVELLDSVTKLRVASVCITLRVDQPPEFIQLPEEFASDSSLLQGAAKGSSGPPPLPRSASSDGQQDRRRSTRRRSLNFSAEKGLEAMIKGVAAEQQEKRIGGRLKVNMPLLRDYERFALENPSLIVPARIVDCMLNWAIDAEPEGSEAQIQLSSMLYKFHRRRSTTVRGGSISGRKAVEGETKREEKDEPSAIGPGDIISNGANFSGEDERRFDPSNSMLAQLVESETEYIGKLELLVEKHRQASAMAKQLVFRSSSGSREAAGAGTDASSSASSMGSNRSSLSSVGRGTVLRLASTFGQTQASATETAVLTAPSVYSCLSATEQMLTIHKSLFADLSALGSDSLTRLASLTKVYASYGATLVEAYLAASQALSPKSVSSAVVTETALEPSSWFRLGASQTDPEDALRWILTAAGNARQLIKPPEDLTKWSLLDLLLCPLERMNHYCQFARELDSPALAALNETRRLLTKSLMRKSNTRLLRELDNGFLELDKSLVDVRRWMLRSSPLVLRRSGLPDLLVQVFLFSDLVVVGSYEGAHFDRWAVMRTFQFGGDRPVFVRDAAASVATSRDASHLMSSTGLSVLNTSMPLGDARFAFEVGTSEDDALTLLMPSASTTVQRQLGQFWQKLGLVAFDKDTATAVGPGGFSNTDTPPRRAEAATVRSTDRSKDMKRKQQLRWEWVSDISRLVRIWGGGKSDTCWSDDVTQLRLILAQKQQSDDHKVHG